MTNSLGASVLCVLLGCSSSGTTGRVAALVSLSAEADRALGESDSAVIEGELARARERLAVVRRSSTSGPMRWLVALRAARIDLADETSAGLANAMGEVSTVPRRVRAPLSFQRALVSGLLSARLGRARESVEALRPIAGRLIDPAQNVEVWCGLGAMEQNAQSDDPAGRALLALSRVVRAASNGVRWARTGLDCDAADSRNAGITRLSREAIDPQRVADAIEVLPDGHALRRVLARRLRDLAPLHGGIHRWRAHLGDLDDAEAMLLPVSGNDGPAALRVTVIAPLSGPGAAYGVEAVRAVQLAFSGESAVVLELVDEINGLTEALSRWATEPPSVVVGPGLEDNAERVIEALAQRDSRRARVFLPVPAIESVARRDGVVNIGPAPERRAAFMVETAHELGLRAVFIEGSVGGVTTWQSVLRSQLASEAVTVVSVDRAPATVTRVVFGAFDRAQRQRLESVHTVGATRRVLDARALGAGAAGRWVGAAPGTAFDRVHQGFCTQSARAPGELALLYYDSARAVLETLRAVPRERALAVDDHGEMIFATAVVRGESDAVRAGVAAARPCVTLPRQNETVSHSETE